MSKSVILSIILLLPAAAAQAQNWPSFRGPNATGVADGKPLPEKWDAEKSANILWKTPIPGLGLGSPVVWGDRVIISTAISSNTKAETFRHGLYGDVQPHADLASHTWKVYALERKSGKIIWERIAHTGTPKTKRHPKATQANATPATDGKHIAVWFGSEGLYTYDWNGKLLWKQDLGIVNAGWFYDADYEWGHASSPIIYKNRVIVQVDRQEDCFIAAFDIKTGKQLWKTQRDELPSWGTPTVHVGKVRAEIITNATNFIRGYDPATGKELWKLARNSEVTATTPFVGQELIFIVGGYPPVRPIFAIRPGASGDITLKEGTESSEFVAWSKKTGGTYMPTPLVYGELLYTCSNNGVLAVYNAKSGEKIYQERIAGKGGAYSASPIAANGNIYLTSEDGEIYVVKAGPKYELVAENKMGEVLMATPAISDGTIFVRSLKHVFAIGEPAAARAGK